jgi:hypothetical protein
MSRRRGARELELEAAGRRAPPAVTAAAGGEALAMLVRRGLRPRLARPDVPFPRDLEGPLAEQLSERLGHYGFRLFLRGAILLHRPFWPAEATRYLSAAQADRAAAELVELGLALREPGGQVRLRWKAQSFGGTLEWWVARELRRRLAVDVAAGVRSGAPGVGGDLDVVVAAEGKLVYVELKSSPPKHIMPVEVAAFLRRVRSLRPHLSAFAVDTALRLPDKVLPLLAAAAGVPGAPRRLQRDCWAIAPGLYAVNARQDLVANLCLAIADGLHRLAPEPP